MPSRLVYTTDSDTARAKRELQEFAAKASANRRKATMLIASAPNGRLTHREGSDGLYVTIQHCDHQENGRYYNVYLGVNYPSDFCDDHRQQ